MLRLVFDTAALRFQTGAESLSENALWRETKFGRSAPVLGRSNVALRETLEKPEALAHWTLLWPRTATLRTLAFQTGAEMSELWQSEKVSAHTACLARSLKHFTGRELFSGASHTLDLAEKVFEAPFVLVSHGTEADPVLNYGNRTALTLWEMTWDELTRTPSRLTAEAPNREERARLLAAVTSHGFIDDYSGVRISKTGRRFRIHRATVWNLVTEAGQPCGQAAMFDAWEFV